MATNSPGRAVVETDADRTMPFADSLGIRPLGEGKLSVEITSDWHVVRGPNGGYLAAVLLAAMQAYLGDPGRTVRVLSVHYPRVPSVGSATLEVRTLRAGRSVTWLSVDLLQEGLCVSGRAAFSTPWTGLDVDVLPRPEPVGHEVGLAKFPGLPPFTRNFDYRSLYSTPMARDGSGLVGGYIRPTPVRGYDAPLLAALSDAWFPGMFAHHGRPVMAATLDLTVHFRDARALSALAPQDYVHTTFRTRLSHEGFFEEDGELWSPEGRLLAQSRQLALATPIGG